MTFFIATVRRVSGSDHRPWPATYRQTVIIFLSSPIEALSSGASFRSEDFKLSATGLAKDYKALCDEAVRQMAEAQQSHKWLETANIATQRAQGADRPNTVDNWFRARRYSGRQKCFHICVFLSKGVHGVPVVGVCTGVARQPSTVPPCELMRSKES